MSRFIGIISFSFLLFGPISYATDAYTPRIAALGGAGHAGPMLNDAVFLNPSFVSFLPSYSFSGSLVKFSGGKYNVDGFEHDYYGRNYTASVQDGRSELFQAGAAYTVREDGALAHIGASKSFLQRFGFGIGSKFFFKTGKSSARDMNLSVTGVPEQWLQLAFVLDNLFQTDPGKEKGFYREFILAAKINIMGIVMLYIDPHVVPDHPYGKSFGSEVGVEFTIMRDLFLRFGSFQNAKVPYMNDFGRGFSLGAGWVAPRISFDYALIRVIETQGLLPPTVAHIFGTTIYF